MIRHLILILVLLHKIHCFGNLFKQVLGADKNTIKDNFSLKEPKCVQGSFFHNGTCYYISDFMSANKYSLSTDNLHNALSDSIKATPIGTQIVAFILPKTATWDDAASHCKKLNNESSLVTFDNRNEYEFLIELLNKINHNQTSQPIASKMVKQRALAQVSIGLSFNESIGEWMWLNGYGLNASFFDKLDTSNYKLELALQDPKNLNYAADKCAYLYVPSNGFITVRNTDCFSNSKSYVCKYVLNRCYKNTMCGQNGECINLPFQKSFQCRCRILYEGKYCEKFSAQGVQIFCTIGLVVCIFILTILIKCINLIYRRYFQVNTMGNHDTNQANNNTDKKSSTLDNGLSPRNTFQELLKKYKKDFKFFGILLTSSILSCGLLFTVTHSRLFLKTDLTNQTNITDTTEDLFTEFIQFVAQSNFSKDMCQLVQDTFIEDYIFAIVSLPLTFFIFIYNSFFCNYMCTKRHNQIYEDNCIELQNLSDADVESNQNLKTKPKDSYIRCCTCRLDYVKPMNPFIKSNRFITAVIYAAYTYNILKIFEYLIIGDTQKNLENITEADINIKEKAKFVLNSYKSSNVTNILTNFSKKIERGILTDLLTQIVNVLMIGFRYYPILICVEMKRKSLLCYSLCSLYMWTVFVFYIYTNIFCLTATPTTAKNSTLIYETTSFIQNRLLDVKSAFKEEFLNDLPVANKTVPMPNTTNLSEKFQNLLFSDDVMYEKFLFYIVLCLLTIHLTVETIFLFIKNVFNIFNTIYDRTKKHRKTYNISPSVMINILNKETSLVHSSEYLYTKTLLTQKRKQKYFIEYLIEKYIYKFKLYFKYSKQLINTYIIAFMLLYYITSIIIRKSKNMINITSEILIFIIEFILKKDEASDVIVEQASKSQLSLYISLLFSNLNYDIILSCCLATTIYVVQLLLGIRNYQKHTLNAYRGVYTDIPSPKRFSNTKKTSSSLHYSGYMIGYLLWGYMILFEVLIVLIVVFRFLLKFYFIIEKFAKYLLPILVIYLFKRIFIWYLTRYFLIKKRNTKFFFLKNFKLYYIMAHFNFFFDCFLGSFVCIMRMVQSCLAAVFFMPRLDYSIYGRTLEHIDMGFISYVNFIHMEVNQTHPIKIAFCELMTNTVKNQIDSISRRKKLVKNRWLLALFLTKNNSLCKERKTNENCVTTYAKVESLGDFVKRNFKRMSKN